MAEHYNTVWEIENELSGTIIDCPCPSSLRHPLKGKSLKTVDRGKD